MILVEPHSVSLVAVISRRIRTHGTGGSLLTGQLCESFSLPLRHQRMHGTASLIEIA